MMISEKISILDSDEVVLTSSQLFTSQLVQSFCEQATSSSLLFGMVCGNLLGSITKSCVTRFFSPIFQKNGSLVLGLSTLSGCFMEGTGIQFVPLLLKGEGIGEEGFRGWLHMGLTLTMMKGIGCAQISNPLIQHLVQDFAMVQWDSFCGVIGFIENRPHSLTEAMLQAEVLSLQMSVSSKLVHCTFVEVRTMEAKLELQSKYSRSFFSSVSAIKKTFFSSLPPLGMAPRLAMVGFESPGPGWMGETGRSIVPRPQPLYAVASEPSGSYNRIFFPPRGERPFKELRSPENPGKTEAPKKPLLTPEYASYLSAWQRVINPGFKPMSMMNNAGGPDRLTGSIIGGRVHECFVIELSALSAKKMKFYLSHWEQIDQTPFLPIPDSWKEAQPDSLSNYARIRVRERFLQEMNLRSEKGYWNVREITQWGIERCILIELKRMGVNPATIHLGAQKKGWMELQYEWGIEGEIPEETHVVYLEGAFPELMAQGKLPKVDIFYQKAVSENMDAETVSYLPDFINPGGFALLGKVQKGLAEQQMREALNRRRLGKNFSKVDVPWAYTLEMHEFIERYVEKQRSAEEENSETREEFIDRANYWWQLYGAKRIG